MLFLTLRNKTMLKIKKADSLVTRRDIFLKHDRMF